MPIIKRTDTVQVQLIVELIGDTHRDHYHFSDNWNFKIGEFNFKKNDNKELEVNFDFVSTLVRYDSDKKITYQETPSEHNINFQTKEKNLELILDLISLETGHCLKIKKDSYSFSCSSSKDLPINNVFTIDIPDIESTERRYQKLVKNKYRKKGLISALRNYRKTLGEEDPGDFIVKLYSGLELIYGQGAGGNMLSDQERKQISKFLNSIGIIGKKKEIVMGQISRIPSKSINELLVEKIKLMDENGTLSIDEKRRLFAFWRQLRSIPAHGNLLPKRGEIDHISFELQSTIEALLYGEIKPKLIYYLVFKTGLLNQEFIHSKGKLVGTFKDYSYFVVRNDEIKIYMEHIKNEIIQQGLLYIVSNNCIQIIDRTGTTSTIDRTSLTSTLKEIIERIIKKIS